MEEFDLVVVGAGSSGLIATYTWLRINPESRAVILESDSELGGAWSRNRIYPTLVTQTPVGMLEYSCFPMPAPEKVFHGLYAGEHVCEYLEAFAQSTKFAERSLKERVRFSSPVTSVKKREKMWEIQTDNGTKIGCRKLIMATGVTSIPRLPSALRRSPPVPVIHSRDLARNAEFLCSSQVQDVVVIGGSKSAFDTVYMLIQAGKSVSWIIRPGGQGPGFLAAPEGDGPFQNSHEILSLRLISKMSPCIFEPDDWWLKFFHQWKVGRWLSNALWRSVDNMWKGAAKYDRNENMSKLKPDRMVFWASDNVGVRNAHDMWDIISGASVFRDEVVKVNEETAILSSGKTLKCDAVVACTGWDLSYSMIAKNDCLELGLPTPLEDVPSANVNVWEKRIREADKKVVERFPSLGSEPLSEESEPTKWSNHLYRSVAPINDEERSVAFLGQVGTTQSFLVSEIQSLWAVAYLMNELELPPLEHMQEDVALRIAWRRRRYLADGHVLIYDQIPVSVKPETLFDHGADVTCSTNQC